MSSTSLIGGIYEEQSQSVPVQNEQSFISSVASLVLVLSTDDGQDEDEELGDTYEGLLGSDQDNDNSPDEEEESSDEDEASDEDKDN